MLLESNRKSRKGRLRVVDIEGGGIKSMGLLVESRGMIEGVPNSKERPG